MTEYNKEGKILSSKQNFEKKPKLSERDCRTLVEIVKKYKIIAPIITTGLNNCLTNSFVKLIAYSSQS